MYSTVLLQHTPYVPMINLQGLYEGFMIISVSQINISSGIMLLSIGIFQVAIKYLVVKKLIIMDLLNSSSNFVSYNIEAIMEILYKIDKLNTA